MPFLLYADFESMLIAYNASQNLSKTNKYQNHIPYSAGYYLKCFCDISLSCYNSYRRHECMDWFAKQIGSVAKFIELKNKNIVLMVVNPKLISNHNRLCHKCEKLSRANNVM